MAKKILRPAKTAALVSRRLVCLVALLALSVGARWRFLGTAEDLAQTSAVTTRRERKKDFVSPAFLCEALKTGAKRRPREGPP